MASEFRGQGGGFRAPLVLFRTCREATIIPCKPFLPPFSRYIYLKMHYAMIYFFYLKKKNLGKTVEIFLTTFQSLHYSFKVSTNNLFFKNQNWDLLHNLISQNRLCCLFKSGGSCQILCREIIKCCNNLGGDFAIFTIYFKNGIFWN